MSRLSAMPMSVVPEEFIHAPVMGVCNYTMGRLLRMGVIGKNEEIAETVLRNMAKVFASNFYDALMDAYENDIEEVAGIYVSLYELWGQQDLIGLYYYLVLSCGLMDSSAPRELIWIARHNEVLAAYLDGFIDACQEYTKAEDEESVEDDEGGPVTVPFDGVYSDFYTEDEGDPVSANEAVKKQD